MNFALFQGEASVGNSESYLFGQTKCRISEPTEQKGYTLWIEHPSSFWERTFELASELMPEDVRVANCMDTLRQYVESPDFDSEDWKLSLTLLFRLC